jgi:putative ABC transport system permease protein
MKTPLAWRNLTHGRVRTAAAVMGVMFAVVLIFLQLGFLGATGETASLIYDALNFDVLIRSQRSRRVTESQPFPRNRLGAAASVAGVGSATPFYVGFHRWRIPRGKDAGYGRRILIMGVRPGDPVFIPPEMQDKTALLTEPEFALVDRLSRSDFGPVDGRHFGDGDLGSTNEVGGRRIRIVGHYALGASFDADGSLIVNDQGFLRLYPRMTAEMVSLGLVKLAPGAEAGPVIEGIKAILPADVDVLSKAEVIARERHTWLWDMSIGMVFLMGVAVAVVVGVAIVYQILSSDVTSHLAEFATLRAVGYPHRFLAKVVLQEAIILALLGYIFGLLAAMGLYGLATSMADIPIHMTLARVVSVLAISIAMCSISGLAALRKLRGADPADLF